MTFVLDTINIFEIDTIAEHEWLPAKVYGDARVRTRKLSDSTYVVECTCEERVIVKDSVIQVPKYLPGVTKKVEILKPPWWMWAAVFISLLIAFIALVKK